VLRVKNGGLSEMHLKIKVNGTALGAVYRKKYKKRSPCTGAVMNNIDKKESLNLRLVIGIFDPVFLLT